MESSEIVVDVYKQAVIDYDIEELSEMRNSVKDYGESKWHSWINFVLKRKTDAERRIQDKNQLQQRMRALIEAAQPDHVTAIAELQLLIKSDENLRGLIPVEMSEFVENNQVDFPKLKTVLEKVEAPWQDRLDFETKRQESDEWQGILAQRIQWPIAELDQNLQSLTEIEQIETERDQLREDKKQLTATVNDFKKMIVGFVLNKKDAMIEYLKEKVWGPKE